MTSFENNELSHYGVKGMKWGVRNIDLTEDDIKKVFKITSDEIKRQKKIAEKNLKKDLKILNYHLKRKTRSLNRSQEKIGEYSEKVENTKIKRSINPIYRRRLGKLKMYELKAESKKEIIDGIESLIDSGGSLSNYIKKNTIDKGANYIKEVIYDGLQR